MNTGNVIHQARHDLEFLVADVACVLRLLLVPRPDVVLHRLLGKERQRAVLTLEVPSLQVNRSGMVAQRSSASETLVTRPTRILLDPVVHDHDMASEHWPAAEDRVAEEALERLQLGVNSLHVFLHAELTLDLLPAAGNGAGEQIGLVNQFLVTRKPVLLCEPLLADVAPPFGIDVKSVDVTPQEILITEHFGTGLALEALVRVISLDMGHQTSSAVRDFVAKAALTVRPLRMFRF